jgi:hypothetical protein
VSIGAAGRNYTTGEDTGHMSQRKTSAEVLDITSEEVLMNSQYEVLSPWAEVDSRPLHGISPRIADINGNKIGLFCNSKLAAAPIMAALEKEFKARFPDSVVSRYDALEQYRILQMEGKNRAEFEKWLKDVDTVIAAVGD